jgi:hypothetical protein
MIRHRVREGATMMSFAVGEFLEHRQHCVFVRRYDHVRMYD